MTYWWIRWLKGWSSRQWFLAWFIFVVVFGLMMATVNVPRLVRLSSQGIATQGTVVERQPTNHDATIVAYAVDGNTYREGSSFVSSPNPRPLAVGDSVLVVYLTSEPRLMSIGDPKPQLSNEITGVVLGALLLPTFGIGVTYLRVRYWKDRQPRTPTD